MTVTSRPSPRGRAGAPRRRKLAGAVLAAPFAWAVHLSASSALVPHACEHGTDAWLHVVTVLTLAVAAAGAVATRRLRATAPTEPDRLVARVGWWLALLSIAVVLAEGMLVLALDPCA